MLAISATEPQEMLKLAQKVSEHLQNRINVNFSIEYEEGRTSPNEWDCLNDRLDLIQHFLKKAAIKDGNLIGGIFQQKVTKIAAWDSNIVTAAFAILFPK